MKKAGRTWDRRWAVCAVFLMIFGVFAGNSVAGENPMDLFADGVMAYEEQNWAEAEDMLLKAMEADPNNPEFSYYLALTYIGMGQNEHAIGILEDLIAAYPVNYRKAYFDIAAIYSRQSQYKKEIEILGKAIEADPSDPRAYYVAAVAEKNAGQYDNAMKNARAAAELDDSYKQQVNNLLGVICYEQRDYDRAEAYFKEVIQAEPGSPLGNAAKQSLDALAKARRANKPWYVNVVFTMGHDDNVVNEPLDPLPNQPPSDKEDWFQNLTLSAGYKFVNAKDMRAGIGMGIYHLGYNDLPWNDVLSYNPHAFFEMDRGRFHGRIRYDFDYYYTGGAKRDIQDWGWYLTFSSTDDKLRQNRITPSLSIDEPYGLRSDITLGWIDKHYLDATPDATGWLIGLMQSYELPKTPLTARAGYTYYDESYPSGSGLSYYYHQFTVGVGSPLFWKVRGDLAYFYIRTHYDQILTDGSKRSDDTNRISATVTCPVTDWLQASLGYSWTDNDSDRVDFINNLPYNLYDYRRNIVSLWLTARF